MAGLYARWMHAWENGLAERDSSRRVRPFEWGLDWLEPVAAEGDPRERLRAFVRAALEDSAAFFSYRCPEDYRFQQGHLTFTSPLQSPYPENNLVHAQYFPARERRRAVLVLPQWNADAAGHVSLCKLLNRFGLSALRMSLPYHDRRMPPELDRADYHLSSNLGRTIQACRQSVIDARACLDWLEMQGYRRLAVLGTSLGSAMGFIAAAHDPRVGACVFNHASMYFGDVVWTGLSTRHVRQGLEGFVTHDELREYWRVISPAVYIDRFVGRNVRSLIIWARHDTTFLPEYSQQMVELFRSRRLPLEVVTLPCGHYTTGQFPFNWVDGLTMCRFVARNL